MSSILLIFVVLISYVLADNGDKATRDYDWDTNGGDLGECEFEGTISTGGYACEKTTLVRDDFQQGGDLTWDILIKACPELKYAGCADESYDDYGEDDDEYVSMDSLTWERCSSCPVCSCSNGDDDIYYTRNRTYVSGSTPYRKDCLRCECDYQYHDDDENQDMYGYECNTRNSGYDPDTLSYYSCTSDLATAEPTPAPTDGDCFDEAENYYSPGETFFKYDGENCTTYCMCNSTEGLECETGYRDIMLNEELKYHFLDDCGWRLADCWNTTADLNATVARWFKDDIDSVCATSNNYFDEDWVKYYQCPYCDCGDYSEGDDWTDTDSGGNILTWSAGSYDDEGVFTTALYDCTDCSCVNYGWITKPISVCTAWDSDEAAQDECLRASDGRQCWEESGGDFEDLSSDYCNDADGGQTYCGWSKREMDIEDDPDVVCIEDQIEEAGTWGCQYDFMCNAFFDSTELADEGFMCSQSEVSFTAGSYDCVNSKWLHEGYDITVNYMCCDTDECNNADISDTNCEETNAALNKYYKATWECAFGDRGVTKEDFVKAIHCGVALDTEKYGVCEVLKDYWTYGSKCLCTAMQQLEKNYGNTDEEDEYRVTLQAIFDSQYSDDSDEMIEWNTAFDCNIDEGYFACDITKDGINKLTINISIMFTICIIFFKL